MGAGNNAVEACEGLGTGYSLISNEEWMTIARSIESVPENWDSGIAGQGTLSRGYSTTSIGGSKPSPSTANCLYDNSYGGSGSCSATYTAPPVPDQWLYPDNAHLYKRTLKLSTTSSEVIWDFSGNIREWVKWQIAGNERAYKTGDDPTQDNYAYQWKELTERIGSGDVMAPETWASKYINFDGNGLPVSGPDKINGIGSLARWNSGSDPESPTTIYYPQRGGSMWGRDSAGIYALLILHGDPNSDADGVWGGFRCVYHP